MFGSHLFLSFHVLRDFQLLIQSCGLLLVYLHFYFSWFSLGRLYVPRNSYSSKLSSFLEHSFSYASYDPLHSVESFVIIPLSFIILLLWVLSLFFLDILAKRWSILFSFKNPNLCLINYLYCFSIIYFTHFCYDLYYFFPYSKFELIF